MQLSNEDRSIIAYELLDDAVTELRTLGFEGTAPHRMMAWTRFSAISEQSSAADAVADLTRLREMIDKHLLDLASGVPQ